MLSTISFYRIITDSIKARLHKGLNSNPLFSITHNYSNQSSNKIFPCPSYLVAGFPSVTFKQKTVSASLIRKPGGNPVVVFFLQPYLLSVSNFNMEL